MTSDEEYRQKLAFCKEMAERAVDEDLRAEWLSLIKQIQDANDAQKVPPDCESNMRRTS